MPTFVKIASTTLSSTTANITFSSIPNTYTDLYIVGSTRGDVGGTNTNCNARYNGDTAANYGYDFTYGVAGTVAGSSNGSATFDMIVYGGPGNTGQANSFGCFWSYIGDYLKTTSKTIITLSTRITSGNTGDTYAVVNSSQYRGSTISSIQYYPSNGTGFVAGTTITLYGIKNS
jgi:hypothetical protein